MEADRAMAASDQTAYKKLAERGAKEKARPSTDCKASEHSRVKSICNGIKEEERMQRQQLARRRPTTEMYSQLRNKKSLKLEKAQTPRPAPEMQLTAPSITTAKQQTLAGISGKAMKTRQCTKIEQREAPKR